MADDAGALLVRSGLVSAKALDEARARVAGAGGTLGEQLVTSGAITDDALTDFYRSRLLVPQVNPNLLARLSPKVVATIPGDMAIELRAIPVSLDGDNNLTVAMSDPSDRHAVDEIAFFTGCYIVRAVATQMQIAWCLAHYYGHVTALGQRLLYASDGASPIKVAVSEAPQRSARAKGLTGKVDAARHHAIAPVTGPVNVMRPSSGELDRHALATAAEVPARGSSPAAAGGPGSTPGPAPASAAPSASADTPAQAPRTTPPTDIPAQAPRLSASSSTLSAAARLTPSASTPAAAPRSTPSNSTPAASPPAPEPSTPTPPTPVSMPASAPGRASTRTPATAPADTDEPTPVIIELDDDERDEPSDDEISDDAPTVRRPSSPDILAPSDGPPDRPRARSISGEIRVPVRRAASIRPPMPSPHDDDDDDDEPMIVIEPNGLDEDTTDPRRTQRRRRAVKTDPPELYARAGEVDLKAGADRSIDVNEPRIVIDENALANPTPTGTNRAPRRDGTAPPVGPDGFEDIDTTALIHDRIIDAESQPILLERPRATPGQFQVPPAPATATAATPAPGPQGHAADSSENTVIVLEAKKPRTRPERRTQVGIPPAPVPVRPHRDTEATGIPAMLRHAERDRTVPVDEDATTLDIQPAPGGDDSSDQIVAPPAPASYGDSNPHFLAPPPWPTPLRPSALRPAVIIDGAGGPDDDEDDDDEPSGPRTSVMTAVELDDAIPGRTAEVEPGHLSRRRVDYDPVDDGWGPPGTTIPPPLLGAIPGGDDDDGDDVPSAIPMPSVDSSPLIVGPPSLPSSGDPSGRALVRALEDATARAIQVIRELEHAETRDQVVGVMIAHLTESHHRAGFLVARNTGAKGVSELSLFAMTPKPAVMPFTTLRLDRPSTLQDVVGTRLPYRGPMHDDASRTFLIAVLGACPPEILLVPVAVRERVVGVLFGEHRQRHTFDDQLALAARAAGMALERILKAKRG